MLGNRPQNEYVMKDNTVGVTIDDHVLFTNRKCWLFIRSISERFLNSSSYSIKGHALYLRATETTVGNNKIFMTARLLDSVASSFKRLDRTEGK